MITISCQYLFILYKVIIEDSIEKNINSYINRFKMNCIFIIKL